MRHAMAGNLMAMGKCGIQRRPCSGIFTACNGKNRHMKPFGIERVPSRGNDMRGAVKRIIIERMRQGALTEIPPRSDLKRLRGRGRNGDKKSPPEKKNGKLRKGTDFHGLPLLGFIIVLP
jgi:hypothetical protein